MTNEQLKLALTPPEGVVDAVIDTDTYNEIDDQFALSYMIRSTEKINLKAIYAAPFFNQHSTSPADGMEKSYKEIFNILNLMGETALSDKVFRGSTSYLPDESNPVVSDAAKHLVSLAAGYTPDKPLYVVAIGAITNVASALLIDPSIADKIVVVWLGGHSFDWPHTKEFNMFQDVAAARVIFNSGAPVVILPCDGVVSAFRVSGDDLRARFYGKNELATYLTTHSEEEVSSYVKEGDAWTRVIWDVTAVAWLTGANGGRNRFMDYRIVPAPICEYDFTYSFDSSRQSIAYVYNIKRDALFNDMIKKLAQ